MRTMMSRSTADRMSPHQPRKSKITKRTQLSYSKPSRSHFCRPAKSANVRMTLSTGEARLNREINDLLTWDARNPHIRFFAPWQFA